MKVRLIGEHDLADRSVVVGRQLKGPGKVTDGTIIKHKDAHWLVKMGRAEEIKEPANESGGVAAQGNATVANSDG